MNRKTKLPFDLKRFLPKWATGKQYRNIRRIRLSFHRVTLGPRFFSLRRARSSSQSFLSGARKLSSESSDLITFLAKDV